MNEEQPQMNEPKAEIKEEQKTQRQIRDEAMLAQLEAAAEKLEKANKKWAANRAAEEAAKIDAILDGDGEVRDPKKGKMTDKEYADKVLAGELP